MSQNNSSRDWSSWNINEDHNRDTRNWDPQSRQQIQQHFTDYEILRSLEALSQDAPEAFREAMRDNPKDPKAAIKALAALNQQKIDQLHVKAGLKAPASKHRKGWDNLEISRSVRNLLNGKG